MNAISRALAAILLTSIAVHPATAGSGSVRAQGMAGAYTAHATGIDAPLWNPANLALGGVPRLSLELASVTARVANNGIDLGLYNEHNGNVLDAQDKEEILAAIPPRGLSSWADATASALGVQWGHMAVSVSGHGLAYSNLPHDVFTLVLEGNAAADSVVFDDAAGEALAFGAINLSGAGEVWRTPWGSVTAGLNLRYLQGFAYAKLTEVTGSLVTNPQAVRGRALAELVTAGSGRGVGLDVGVATDLADGWQAGLSLQNAYAIVRFHEELERRLYTIETADINVEAIENAESEEELVSDNEFIGPADPFTVTLPRILSLGLARVGASTTYAFEYTQGFSRRAGSTTAPRVALGGEVRPTSWLPLRLGLAMGGTDGPTSAVGLGLALGSLSLDFAAATHGRFLPGDSKGITMSVGTGLRF